MSKEVKTMMGTPTKTVYLAKGSSQTVDRHGRNKHMTKLVPLNVVNSCMAGTDWGGPDSVTRI